MNVSVDHITLIIYTEANSFLLPFVLFLFNSTALLLQSNPRRKARQLHRIALLLQSNPHRKARQLHRIALLLQERE